LRLAGFVRDFVAADFLAGAFFDAAFLAAAGFAAERFDDATLRFFAGFFADFFAERRATAGLRGVDRLAKARVSPVPHAPRRCCATR